MIEYNLRKWLRPVVARRQRLFLWRKLALYWFIAALAGIVLISVNSLWGWSSTLAIWILCISVALATALVWYKSRSIEPDYKAIARSIEKLNPELQAALLTAIEQEPQGPGGQFGYLQERVIGEALAHARGHDWTQSIPRNRLVFALCCQIVSLLFFMFVLLQLFPSGSFLSNVNIGIPTRIDYNISVSPGDITIELGAPVVITARFDGLLPQQVYLQIGPSEEEMQTTLLTKNLEDPVFGHVISQVNSDMLYHIEYANRRTQDYKITTYEHPSLQRADAKIVYPAFTNLPEKILKDTRQFSVVEGSQVTLTFTLNKTVDIAQLIDRDGSILELTMSDEQPNIFTASITPFDSLRYELKLVDADGLANKVPPRFLIDVLGNLPAEVTLTFPSRDVEASAIEELSLEAKVSDDFGVTAHGVSYTLSGTQTADITLGQSVPANQEKPIQYLLALEELNAEPTQLLTYYFWAEDIGPDGNNRRSFSDLYFTEIRPFEEIFRENQSFQDQNSQQEQEQQQQSEEQQQQQGDQNEELIQIQKQIISATWNVKRHIAIGGIEENREDLDLVRESQAEALDMARSGGESGQGQGSQQGTQRGGGRGARGGGMN